MTTVQEGLEDLADRVSESMEDAVVSYEILGDDLSVQVRPDKIVDVLHFLRDDRECAFRTLIDITAVDWPERAEARFDVVYHLLSLTQNQRIRVKAMIPEGVVVPTATGVFSCANWLEREVWDMFGIVFNDHPDLRRILTDYGFDGHPLRKDFPMTGYVEVRYDPELRRVVYEPVKLTQDFRAFDFESPWEAITTMQLPGDEKAAKPKVGWKPGNQNLGISESRKGKANG